MDYIYLLTKFHDAEDFTSFVFVSKARAIKYISENFPEFKPYAEDKGTGVEFWTRSHGEGILLEKLEVTL